MLAVKLTIVGCAPAWTRRPGRASSCYLVEQGETALVFDLGQGAFAELSRYREPETVSAIFISHLHADHCVDLIPLRHYLTYEREGGRPAIFGPPELRRRFDAFQHADFLSGFGGRPLEPGSSVEVGGLQIEAQSVTHIPASFAFRVSVTGSAGPGLAYSGDCSVADDLLTLVRPGDTLLCEAAFGVGPSRGGIHLTATEAAAVAAERGARRLILTHILDASDEEASRDSAQEVFSGPVEIARPGLSIDIG